MGFYFVLARGRNPPVMLQPSQPLNTFGMCWPAFPKERWESTRKALEFTELFRLEETSEITEPQMCPVPTLSPAQSFHNSSIKKAKSHLQCK